MVFKNFNPYNKHNSVSATFPEFTYQVVNIVYLRCNYLGHIIENSLCDYADINRELKCLFARSNLLKIRFMHCSADVKLKLLKTFCICFHDFALSKH